LYFFKYFPIFKGCFLQATDISPSSTATAPVTVPVRACSVSLGKRFWLFSKAGAADTQFDNSYSESQNQRNTTGEVATTSPPFATNRTDRTFFM